MELKILASLLLGAILSSIGYLIKTRQENKKFINEVLFNLLEIWKIVNMSIVFTSNVFPKALVARIKERYPKENTTEEDEKTFQKLLPQALELVDKESGFPEANLYGRYLDSIQKLSSVQPFLAHSLSGNNMMLKYLKGMENYIEKHSPPETAETEEQNKFSEKFINDAKLFMESDLLENLESDLRWISLRSSIFNWYSVMAKIIRSKKTRKTIPQESIDKYIDLVIEPLIRKHYENLNHPYPY